ncbi:MAG: hypothetical protein HQL37_06315, partial [Alphaproteobacteria bacterium]|nr:hypothetical protein [Alphaproteobacteria bacterium]
MSIKNRFLLAALVAALPTVASAQTSGYYIGAGAGADWLSNSKATGGGITVKSRYNAGPDG